MCYVPSSVLAEAVNQVYVTVTVISLNTNDSYNYNFQWLFEKLCWPLCPINIKDRILYFWYLLIYFSNARSYDEILMIDIVSSIASVAILLVAIWKLLK